MPLKVIVVDAKSAQSDALDHALRQAGFVVLKHLRDYDDLFECVATLKPDAVIVDSDSPKRDTLEHLAHLSERHPKPMVMFSEHGDPELTAAAARAGVSAYVVSGLSPGLVRSLIDVAVLHFHDQQSLLAELDKTRQTLAERDLIGRAKCLLMEREGLSEQDAYAWLRKQAMAQSRRMVHVAKALLKAAT